jgi:septum formation protein
VERLARSKAEGLEAAGEGAGEIRLGSDTVVVVDGEVLGKPAGAVEAREMLRRLSGREHEVLSGVAIHVPGPPARTVSAVARTRVTFRALEEVEIEAYVATGEPLDKAGAYGIQGRAAVFVARLEGSYDNVVGLPLATVDGLLCDLGYRWLDFVDPAEE